MSLDSPTGLIVRIIGFSYSCLEDPNAGPILTFLGFTLGVGLCEEFAKAIPIMYALDENKILNGYDACLVGLASGMGFGIAESIHYSEKLYNGQAGAETYLIRFISLVSLHAMWSGIAAIFVFNNNVGLFQFKQIPKVLGISLLLHGLYDRLITRDDYEFAAKFVAIATFGLFGWLIQRHRTPVSQFHLA